MTFHRPPITVALASVSRSRRRERGAALVEYAFIFILFMSLLFGISGFGHFLYIYHAVNHAAKEGSRWAIVNGYLCTNDSSCTAPASTSDIQNYITTYLVPASMSSSQAAVSAAFTTTPSSPPVCTTDIKNGAGTVVQAKEANYPGCTVQVTVSYPYQIIFPLLPTNTTTTSPRPAPGFCISSTSEMVIVH